jgi:hypothetical protein
VLAAAAVGRAGGRTASLTASTMAAFSGGWEGTGTCGDDGNTNRGCLSSPGLATSLLIYAFSSPVEDRIEMAGPGSSG